MSLLVVGSVAYDALESPYGKVERTLGGAATYFAVADADDAVARASDLGGTVVRPPWDSPYGRMAVLADDQGAVFAVGSNTGAEEA